MAHPTGGEEKTAGLWTILENGAQATESPELIRAALDRLRANREMVTLAHRGYESAKTVIVDYSGQELEVDRPPDWPGTHENIFILFKDESLVWNHMQVKILRSTAGGLFTGFPSRLVRIQRRANYRVNVPRGSTALFRHEDIPYRNVEVANISATGVLLKDEKNLPIGAGDALVEMLFFFPGLESGLEDGTRIAVRRARVVRTCRDDYKKYCFGIVFELTASEEKVLLHYVRQRERELLRKGLE